MFILLYYNKYFNLCTLGWQYKSYYTIESNLCLYKCINYYINNSSTQFIDS